ncbi:MAG: hypothetical protein KBH14_10430 [Vicinamibacteria bacterium]|nr:hypothetical protein [Vicinamibacteria bacterium]
MKDSKVTIALFGEGNVEGAQPWMRSTMAATFENQLVGAKRFRVVSQTSKWIADGNATGSASGLYDPSEVVRVGKQAQAKYAVVLRMTRVKTNKRGFGPLAWTELDMAMQAQVMNTETNVLVDSKPFEAKFKTGLKPTSGPTVFNEGDFGSPFSDAVKGFAEEFVSTTVTALMPLDTVVADVSAAETILAAGSDIGVAAASEFDVLKESPLKLPDGTTVMRTTRLARLRVVRVEARISYTEIIETYGDGGIKDPTPNTGRIQTGMLARLATASEKREAGKKK